MTGFVTTMYLLYTTIFCYDWFVRFWFCYNKNNHYYKFTKIKQLYLLFVNINRFLPSRYNNNNIAKML